MPSLRCLSHTGFYGRIASNLFAPVYQWGNNLLAYLAERADSYAFYETEVWMKSLSTFIIAAITFYRTVHLGMERRAHLLQHDLPGGYGARFPVQILPLQTRHRHHEVQRLRTLRPQLQGVLHQLKAHEIDYSRCVACMDCLDKCKQGAITYTRRHKSHTHRTSAGEETASAQPVDDSRRAFSPQRQYWPTTTALKAQEKKVDGGLAAIEEKKIPERATAITPPGSMSARNFAQHCTACQLCVSVCPNQVLRPSSDLTRLMQPEMSYERGYCRPECTKCAEVCPAGAIRPITKADKSAIQIGARRMDKGKLHLHHRRWECGSCARHCPVGAIQMVASDPETRNPEKYRLSTPSAASAAEHVRIFVRHARSALSMWKGISCTGQCRM